MHVLPCLRRGGTEWQVSELRRRARDPAATTGRKARQISRLSRTRAQAGRVRERSEGHLIGVADGGGRDQVGDAKGQTRLFRLSRQEWEAHAA